MYVCMYYVRMYVCTYVRMSVCIYVCMYIRTQPRYCNTLIILQNVDLKPEMRLRILFAVYT